MRISSNCKPSVQGHRPKLAIHYTLWGESESKISCRWTPNHVVHPKRYNFDTLAEARAFAVEKGYSGISIRFL